MSKFEVLILNPYNSTAIFIPAIHNRILRFGRDVIRNPQFEMQANYLISRLTMRDPKILILFAIDEFDKVVAHCVAEILDIDDLKICFVGQTESTAPGVLDKALYILDNWARAQNCDKVRTESIATRFNEKSATRLLRRWGYKLISYSFERDISDGRKILQNESHAETGPESGSPQ